LLVAAMLAAAASPTASAEITGPSAVRAVPWHTWSVDGRYSITVFADSGYCVGWATPEFWVNSAEAELPRRNPGLLLTLYERSEVLPPAVIEGNVIRGGICADVGLRIWKRIKLAHPVLASILYDGSRNPPVRRAVCSRYGERPRFPLIRGPYGVAPAVRVC
jgi:hypothetical protein